MTILDKVISDTPRPVTGTVPKGAPTLGASQIEQIKGYDLIALVLQGGGALGAYQGGVFEALSEAGIEARWFSGVSIGAINGAIMAGNAPGNRLDRLHDFWETLSRRKIWALAPEGDQFRRWHNAVSAMMTLHNGLPGFFRPHQVNPWFAARGASNATSFYDTSDLRDTLNRLVDWDLLNDSDHRLSVGAVNVETGNFRYFDSALERIGPEHIMASGALPPAFAPVKIESEHYWDGGIVSNTPLQYLLECETIKDTLVFQIDLFNARGALPRDMNMVLDRHKDILYSSRTRHNTDMFRRNHHMRLALRDALLRVPAELRTPSDAEFLAGIEDVAQVNIVHMVYQKKAYEGQSLDYEFSATSMREHWQAGLDDTRRTLAHKDWMVMPPEAVGVTVHDVHQEDPT